MHGAVADERVGWRFATAADINAYFGEPPDETMRALVFTLNDEVAGVIGIARQWDSARFFGEFNEEFRKHLRSIPALRAIKQVQNWIRQSVLPVYVIAEETEPDAVRFLTRLGFVPFEDNILKWPQ
jgi:phosphoglycolate phosphatase-like HAD superfamily hydrolase